ncbi:MAG: DUF2867 domain-containing protein [SAR324 cluster bacterium]|nr:DUF2867 domain-containing protein [SAR324 cluster bacterium]
MDIIEVELNNELLIARHIEDFDYCDVFQSTREVVGEIPQPKDCMIAFFRSFPPLLTRLIITREIIAKKLGLKTANEITNDERNKLLDRFEGNIGDSIAIFEVLEKNDIELLTGQTDRHLDFNLSFISYIKNNNSIIELATIVKFHNIFGKIYFFFVRPFHKLYMKKILKRMTKYLEKNN